MRAAERIKDNIVGICLGICAFILGFFMFVAVILMIILIAKMIVTTPATAGSLPQVPGFAVAPPPSPPQFRDPSPSDRSRCDGVWRPVATCP